MDVSLRVLSLVVLKRTIDHKSFFHLPNRKISAISPCGGGGHAKRVLVASPGKHTTRQNLLGPSLPKGGMPWFSSQRPPIRPAGVRVPGLSLVIFAPGYVASARGAQVLAGRTPFGQGSGVLSGHGSRLGGGSLRLPPQGNAAPSEPHTALRTRILRHQPLRIGSRRQVPLLCV